MSASIDFRQLRAFVTVVDAGGFTAAAGRLGLTQSAVSHAIKALQDDLGCSLLFRVGKKVHTTKQGEALYHHAVGIFRQADQIRPHLASLEDMQKGTLRIGCTASAAQFLLPGVFREFRECFPEYTIQVRTGDTPAITEMLESNEVDVGLGLLPPERDLYAWTTLFVDEIMLMVGHQHEWSTLRRAPRNRLGEATYLIYPRGSLTHALFEEYLLAQGARMRSTIELASLEAIKELVKIGVGVGVLAPWIARTEMANGSIHALPLHPRIRREWAAFWLKNRPLNLAEETMVGLCEAVGKAHVA